ncbi:MAG: GNAT family N-acetyltransferase [Promethearchaeota archaeon]
MNEILNQISQKSINYYIEANLDDFYTKSSEHTNFVSRIDDRISWVLSKKGDWPDCIFKANFENLNLKKEISTVKKLIRKKKVPNGWTIGPLTVPENLGSNLEKYGFLNVYQQAGMAAELENLKNIVINEDDLDIQKVDNEKELANWSKVVSKVFNLRINFDFLKFLRLQKEIQFYLGKYEGNVVSALMLYLGSGVAGLHAVSTLSEYRGKGFGLSISRKALIDAFQKGYYIGVLQASTMGERVYRKLGFLKYCDIISYALN